MANWYGAARSNYFFVKDPEAFRNEFSKYPLEVIENQGGPKDSFLLLPTGEYGDFDTWIYDGDEGEEEEFDVLEKVAPHLKDGHVAIIMTTGAEKLRYLTGYAQAINNKGERREVNINSIHELAKEIGEHIEHCSY